ncbi:MAG: hypothetical protein IKI64_06180 [Clostridia bacterium]|nr:hypothetical protein [Clostridia bacterium]
MKRLSITAIILSAILLSLLSCAKNGGAGTETNTAEPAETVAPALPVLPARGRLGNLIGGEIFPDPAKYLVLKGEGDLYYIYDRMGEFVTVCKGMGYLSGFYGEDGIVGNFSLRLMQNMDDWQTFGQLMLHIVDGELIEFIDCYTDKTVQVKSKGLSIGEQGGVLPFDDKYLVIEAYHDENADKGRELRYERCTWLDQNGDIAGEFDPAPFGRIRGVYGGKHIIAIDGGDASEDEDHFKTKIYSLSGEALLENIESADAAVFYTLKEGEVIDGSVFERRLTLAEYAYTEFDRWYDSAPEPMRTPPADAYDVEYNRMRRSIELEDRIVIGDNSVNWYSLLFWESTPEPIRIYVGVKDGAGNWLFKIFNPALANDSKRRPRSVFGIG